MSRKKGREYAFRLVFEKFFHEPEIDLEFSDEDFVITDEDRDFVNDLIGGINSHYDEIFEMGQSGWTGAKYIPTDRILKTYDEFLTYFNNLKESIENADSNSYIKETWLKIISDYIESYKKEFFDENILILTESIFSPVCNEILEVIDVCLPIRNELYIFVKITHPALGLTMVKNTVFEIIIPKDVFSENENIDIIHLIY